MSEPRVCIVSHNAFGAMSGGRGGHAGGVERQTSTLARWLAAHDVPVSIVVWQEGQPAETVIDGVRVIALCRRDAGVPGLRFFHPRWTSLARALAAADADVYYHNCAEYVTGQVALWARSHGRRFVYSVASDPECDPALPALRHWRERVLFRYGLRHADARIVQTRRQQRLLRDGWGLTAEVLPMPCPGPPDGFVVRPPVAGTRPRVVWVARISPEKRVDRLLDVAAALPGVDFDVAGGALPGEPALAALRAGADALPNVRLRGQVARQEMSALYAGATCLLCTSDYEGFPNTFLEAWSHGVPVVSTVDPDEVIATHGLGRVGADAATLAAHVAWLAADAAAWRTASAAARDHHSRYHAPEPALAAFARVLRATAGPGADAP